MENLIKQTLYLFLGLFLLLQYGICRADDYVSFGVNNNIETAFSPYQGEYAFNKIFEKIRSAKKYVHLTVYSWYLRDHSLENALVDALAKNVKVRIVLHPPLIKKSSVQKKIEKLEGLGAELKVSVKNMHEKFVIIDDEFLVNSSANMSEGARSSYSEAFVFFERTREGDTIDYLIRDFRNEFTVLWNSSKDLQTHGEPLAEALGDYTKIIDGIFINLPAQDGSMILYSSSMNWNLKENRPSTQAYKLGRYLALKKRMNGPYRTWLVADSIIEAINNAQYSIVCGFNHFNIRAISDALIAAVKRGVDVKLVVDNQEFKTKPNNKEMTPQFVKDWLALQGNNGKVPPVRVKFYSHAPSPKYWFLNHHKFLLVDYVEGAENPLLITGSYNLSKTAEHNQFDNMVFYSGSDYEHVYREFYDEYVRLWFLNRDKKDRPSQKILKLFTTPLNNGSYPIHSLKQSVSLSWNEIMNLRRKVAKKAKGIFKGLNYKKRNCMFYSPKSMKYWGSCEGF